MRSHATAPLPAFLLTSAPLIHCSLGAEPAMSRSRIPANACTDPDYDLFPLVGQLGALNQHDGVALETRTICTETPDGSLEPTPELPVVDATITAPAPDDDDNDTVEAATFALQPDLYPISFLADKPSDTIDPDTDIERKCDGCVVNGFIHCFRDVDRLPRFKDMVYHEYGFYPKQKPKDVMGRYGLTTQTITLADAVRNLHDIVTALTHHIER